MRKRWAAWLLLGAGTPALAQAGSMQAQYEAASALDATGTPDQRLAAWTALEARAGNNKRSRAIMRVRKSAALLALGRLDDAAAAAGGGLADLPATDPTLRQDRFNAQFELGQIAEVGLDYASAAAAFSLAEALAVSPDDKLGAELGLVRTATYVDPGAAAAAVTRADALMAEAKTAAPTRAKLRRHQAELLLNAHDLKGAKAQAAEAVKLLGGLTEKVRLEDLSARSDYAIAALLGGDAETARRYLAYTGAGHLPKGFDPGLSMHVPDCGGEAGLRPQDDAVVEFSIADDGAVVGNRPVYSSAGGAVALAFARATGDWSWRPERVSQLPPFFRNRIRVELRCGTAFTRPSIIDYLDARLDAWLGTKGAAVAPRTDGSPAAALPAERARLAAATAKAGPESLALVDPLRALTRNGVLPRDEKSAFARQALAILEQHGAQGTALLAMEARVWATQDEETGRFFRDKVPALAAARYPNDAEARGAADLLSAGAFGRAQERERALLQTVADDPALEPKSPVRVAALIRLASLEHQAGHEDAAKVAYAKTNLSADQCALVDSPPRMLGVGGSSNFPTEALRWGFEGWTQVEYDVRADGRVANERTVVSYPPFVFADAGAKEMATARFASTFRPDGALGCGGLTNRVRFVLPDHR